MQDAGNKGLEPTQGRTPTAPRVTQALPAALLAARPRRPRGCAPRGDNAERDSASGDAAARSRYLCALPETGEKAKQSPAPLPYLAGQREKKLKRSPSTPPSLFWFKFQGFDFGFFNFPLSPLTPSTALRQSRPAPSVPPSPSLSLPPGLALALSLSLGKRRGGEARGGEWGGPAGAAPPALSAGGEGSGASGRGERAMAPGVPPSGAGVSGGRVPDRAPGDGDGKGVPALCQGLR